jgi:hypothetical protein
VLVNRHNHSASISESVSGSFCTIRPFLC